jgi:hypothetical protein
VWLETPEQASAAADNATLLLEESRLHTISLIEQIAQYNPTQNVTEEWKLKPSANKLEGSWKLRFTTAPDATFKPDAKGPALTSQYVNATTGVLTNIIEYRENPGALRAILVEVGGEAQSERRLALTFQKVLIRRNATGPFSLLNRVEIPLPNFGKAPLKQLATVVGAMLRVLKVALWPLRLLWRLGGWVQTRWGARSAQTVGRTDAEVQAQVEGQTEGQTEGQAVQTKTEGQTQTEGAVGTGTGVAPRRDSNSTDSTDSTSAYLDVLYLDEDLRVHVTGRGDFFVQTRLYDVWDPMVGWKQITLL